MVVPRGFPLLFHSVLTCPVLLYELPAFGPSHSLLLFFRMRWLSLSRPRLLPTGDRELPSFICARGVGTPDEMPKTFGPFHRCEHLKLGHQKRAVGGESTSCMIRRRFREGKSFLPLIHRFARNDLGRGQDLRREGSADQRRRPNNTKHGRAASMFPSFPLMVRILPLTY